jgi:hypothetical protein
MRRICLQETEMRLRHAFRLLSLVTIAVLVLAGSVTGQAKRYPLDSTAGLRLHNVVAEPAVLQGKKGVRIRHSEEALRRLEKISGDEQARFPQLAIIEGLEFSNGVIEAEIAGTPPPGEGGARGFVGIAFRLQNDATTYDAFYLRPTNGAQTIKSGAIMPFSTSHTRTGPGSGCGRKIPRNMNRTSTSCRASGRRSRSTCVANARVSTSTTKNSQH